MTWQIPNRLDHASGMRFHTRMCRMDPQAQGKMLLRPRARVERAALPLPAQVAGAVGRGLVLCRATGQTLHWRAFILFPVNSDGRYLVDHASSDDDPARTFEQICFGSPPP